MNLKVENLCCERNHRLLFSGVGFELDPGELIQIDGPNGSGKTTLLRTVCGLHLPQAGQVLWCEEPIDRIRAEFLSKLAFVGHKHGLKDELTARENLRVDRLLAGECSGMSDGQALSRLGIEECGDQLCGQLSAGQRQRVALARLLVGNATLWVLDEPLTALDREAQGTVRDLLSGHMDNGGMVLLSSHQEFDWKSTFRKVRL